MKNNKGITLTALVITIIVLVILAGVSISYITGENNILSKLDNAAAKNREADVKESIRLAWVKLESEASKDLSTKRSDLFTESRLNELLKSKGLIKSGTLTYSEDGLTSFIFETTEPIASYFITVNGTGLVMYVKEEDRIPSMIGSPINSNKYGYEVPGYKSVGYTGKWRLFYQDADYTYLITDRWIGGDGTRGGVQLYHFYDNNFTGADVTQVGKDLNGAIRDYFVETNTYTNIKETVGLTNINNPTWQAYKDVAGKASFVIGGPTMELFIASFNATAAANGKSALSYSVGATGGYDFWAPLRHLHTNNSGIYNPGGKGHFWLASPNNYGSYDNYMWFVDAGMNGLSRGPSHYQSNIGLRPIACIRTDIFNGAYEFQEYTVPDYMGPAWNTDKYGNKVEGYTPSNGYAGDWRLFYQDANYTYIITDDLIGDRPGDHLAGINSGADVSEVGRNLNEKIKHLFTTSYTGAGMKATAWLTNTNNWTGYTDAEGKAMFAIGSPTVDIFVASFNATAEAAGKSFIQTEAGTYGYKITGINSDFIDNRNNGIYGRDGGGYANLYIMASPLTNIEGQSWVNGGNGLGGHAVLGYSLNVRPVVCFRTSVFNANYTIASE